MAYLKDGKKTPVQGEQNLDPDERTLTSQSLPDSDTESPFVSLPSKRLERRVSSDPN